LPSVNLNALLLQELFRRSFNETRLLVDDPADKIGDPSRRIGYMGTGLKHRD
jgi:hypothetical protein